MFFLITHCRPSQLPWSTVFFVFINDTFHEIAGNKKIYNLIVAHHFKLNVSQNHVDVINNEFNNIALQATSWCSTLSPRARCFRQITLTTLSNLILNDSPLLKKLISLNFCDTISGVIVKTQAEATHLIFTNSLPKSPEPATSYLELCVCMQLPLIKKGICIWSISW